jgi:hypothetical protein
MAAGPLFTGLVVDEEDQLVEAAFIGAEPCYVVDDDGFLRHIPAEEVDRQVLNIMLEGIEGHEEIISEQAAKMTGQDDIFSRAVFLEQLKNLDRHVEELLEQGFPEEGRAYMGMTGFKVVINHHGEVVEVVQPGRLIEDE